MLLAPLPRSLSSSAFQPATSASCPTCFPNYMLWLPLGNYTTTIAHRISPFGTGLKMILLCSVGITEILCNLESCPERQCVCVQECIGIHFFLVPLPRSPDLLMGFPDSGSFSDAGKCVVSDGPFIFFFFCHLLHFQESGPGLSPSDVPVVANITVLYFIF